MQQSEGYSNLKKVKHATIPVKKAYKDGFTGEKNDRPGPERYNPKV
jgi:hypothetical protein